MGETPKSQGSTASPQNVVRSSQQPTRPQAREELTDNDRELIEMAYSTTYRSSIKRYIEEADTERAKKILRSIYNDSENGWED